MNEQLKAAIQQVRESVEPGLGNFVNANVSINRDASGTSYSVSVTTADGETLSLSKRVTG